MKNLISAYLDDMKLAWATTTLRSERYRLFSVAEALDGDPMHLWGLLHSLAPYSRLTTWTRVCMFWDWLLENKHRSGTNEYRIFKRKNAKLFKHVYVRRSPDITITEARAKINAISDFPSREKAKELLASGMRYSESLTLQDGWVDGKAENVDVSMHAVVGPKSTRDHTVLSIHSSEK